MKILIVNDLHWPSMNGVAFSARTLAIGLARRGHDVQVIAPSTNAKNYSETDTNHKVWRIASVQMPMFAHVRMSLAPQRQVRKIIDQFQPDVIHAHTSLSIGPAAVAYGKRNGIPVVTTNHAMPENMLENMKILAPISKPIERILDQWGKRFHNRADIVTMPTASAIEMFSNYSRGVDIIPVSNGIDLTQFLPGDAPDYVYEKYKLPRDASVVTYVGRIDADKHVSILVDAFDRLRKTNPDTHLLLIGGGNDDEVIAESVRSRGLSDYVSQTGRVSEQDKIDLLKAGKIFAMPSPVELQSIATLEAMASGQAVVAVDAGALGELCLDGQNGFLVELDDANAIANAIAKILDNPALFARMSTESLAIAKTHDIDTTLETFEKIYDSLIKN